MFCLVIGSRSMYANKSNRAGAEKIVKLLLELIKLICGAVNSFKEAHEQGFLTTSADSIFAINLFGTDLVTV